MATPETQEPLSTGATLPGQDLRRVDRTGPPQVNGRPDTELLDALGLVRDTAAPKSPPDPTSETSSSKTATEEMAGRLRCYSANVEALGVVSGILVGSHPRERRGYIWNVLSEDFSLDRPTDPRFRQLNSLIYGLERDLAELLPLRISHVNPSQLDEHRRRCVHHNIETQLLAF